jgi:hypothetical protein
LDSIATRLQKFSHYFWDCLGVQPKGFFGYTLLQYIDDLLLAGPTQEDFMEGTRLLFSLLLKAGYKISPKESSDFPGYFQIP